MSAGCPHEVDLFEWLERPSAAGHVATCRSCAGALADMRRVRALARALGRAPGRADHRPAAAGGGGRRWRALRGAQRLASTAAALALFAAIGAEPLLRRRIDDGPRQASGHEAAPPVGAVFFTSVAAGAGGWRVGR